MNELVLEVEDSGVVIVMGIERMNAGVGRDNGLAKGPPDVLPFNPWIANKNEGLTDQRKGKTDVSEGPVHIAEIAQVVSQELLIPVVR